MRDTALVDRIRLGLEIVQGQRISCGAVDDACISANVFERGSRVQPAVVQMDRVVRVGVVIELDPRADLILFDWYVRPYPRSRMMVPYIVGLTP